VSPLILKIFLIIYFYFKKFKMIETFGDWGLGIGDWPNPQSPKVL
jgi:hypothetical protein